MPQLLEGLAGRRVGSGLARRHQLRELIGWRQPAFLDRLDGDTKDDVRPGEILLWVVRGERQPDVARFALGLPDEAIRQSRNQPFFIDLELGIGLAFADQHRARLDDMGVDRQEIAELHRTLDGMQFRVAVAQPLDRLVHIVIADLRLRPRHLDVLVVLERDFRLDRHRCREFHRLAAIELLHLDARHVDRVEPGFVERRVVGSRKDQVKGLLAQRRPADFAFNHRSRRLARSEAGDPHPRRQPAVRLVDRPRNLVGIYLDRKDNLRARLALGIDFHRGHGDLRYQFGRASPLAEWPSGLRARGLEPPSAYATRS